MNNLTEDIAMLRAKAAELRIEPMPDESFQSIISEARSAIALTAELLADHLELHTTLVHQRVRQNDLTTVTVEHDASFNENQTCECSCHSDPNTFVQASYEDDACGRCGHKRIAAESPISEWHAGDDGWEHRAVKDAGDDER